MLEVAGGSGRSYQALLAKVRGLNFVLRSNEKLLEDFDQAQDMIGFTL